MTTLAPARPWQAAFAPALPALGIGLAVWGALFWQECLAAYRVWQSSTAYGHCFLVLPMALWLAWDRKERIAAQPVRPVPAAAAAVLAMAPVWLAAERLGIMEGRHLVAMTALQALFFAVLGRRMYRALAAPLLYLYFLIPFGAYLTPLLQDVTARFIEAGLTVLGIPHVVTDYLIEIPAGLFYVAEACAGLRFLIASIAFGVFYALLNYRSPGRRIVFIAASIAVPIVANGFRALGIVLLGHVLGSAEAAAADHLVYGWAFFSVVLLLLVLAGLPLREAPAPAPAARPMASGGVGMRPVLAAALVSLALCAGPAAAAVLDRGVTPVRLAAPPEFRAPEGCAPVPDAAGDAAPLGPSVTRRYDCAGVPLAATLLVVPPRSTPDKLRDAQRRLAGEADAEDAEVSSLRAGRPEPRDWRVVTTLKPARVTALAVWIEGRPAEGGLRGRLVQARAAVQGAERAPVMLLVSAGSGRGEATPEQRERALAAVRDFIEAQTGLDAEVERASRVVPADRAGG